MNKVNMLQSYLVILLLFLFTSPVASVEASGGKSTVGITIQQEETSSSEQLPSTPEKKTYGTTNDVFPKTGEKIQGQYILLGIGVIGLLCVRRRGFNDDERL